MKKHLFNRLSIILLAMIGTFPFTSCSDDEAPDPDRGQIIDPDADVDDPTSTVSLAMRNQDNGNTRLGYIYIDDGNNFSGSSSYFASIGKVRGLGNVSDIPTSGWASQVAVNPGYGYVAYNGGDNQFYRIYVEDYIVSTGGGIIGADIKYQTPFKGRDEAISLDQKSLTFTSEGGSQALVFKNKGIVLFDCESSADWCRVQKSTTYDQSFLYNGVTITVEPGLNTTEEEATVTLTTAYGKETEIKVTRAGAEPFIKFASGETKQVDATEQTYTESLMTNYQPDELQISTNAEWCEASLQDNSRALALAMAQIKTVEGQDMTRATSNNGVTSYNLQLDVKANYTTNERQCEVTVRSKDGKTSAKFTVIQNGTNFRINRTEVTVDAAEGTTSISYTSTLTANELIAESNTNWCSVTIDEPYSKCFYLAFEENKGIEAREASIKITNRIDGNTLGSIKLIQNGHTFTPEKDHVWFDKNSANVTISISTDMQELPVPSSDASWCTLSTNRKDLTIRVTAATTERTATIKFAGISKTITVTQSKYAVGDEYSENGVTGTVVLMNDEQRLIAKNVGSAEWSTENVETGANDRQNGIKNMEIIKQIPDWETLYPAFALCDELNKNGVTGWYLPAVEETKASKITGVYIYELWSSTEAKSSTAYTGGGGTANKTHEALVYAFRKF